MEKWKKDQNMKKCQKRGGMSLKRQNVTLRVFRAIWWGHFCQTAWTPVFCNSPSKSMFWHFWPFFTLFSLFPILIFVTFDDFDFLYFVTFVTFCIFLILIIFHVFGDFDEIMFFYCFSLFFKFENSRVKIRPSFDLFLAPASTPMASTWWWSFLNGDFFSLFFDIFGHFEWFLINFWWFFDFAIKNRDFLTVFWSLFEVSFWSILYFLVNFDPLFWVLGRFWHPP